MKSEALGNRGYQNYAATTILIGYSVLAYHSFRLTLLQSGSSDDYFHRFLSDITTIGYALGPFFALVGTVVFVLIATRLVALLGNLVAPEYEIGTAYVISFVVRFIFSLSILLFDAMQAGNMTGYYHWRYTVRIEDPMSYLLLFEVFEIAILGILQSFVAIGVLARRTRISASIGTLLLIWLPFAIFQSSQLLFRFRIPDLDGK